MLAQHWLVTTVAFLIVASSLWGIAHGLGHGPAAATSLMVAVVADVAVVLSYATYLFFDRAFEGGGRVWYKAATCAWLVAAGSAILHSVWNGPWISVVRTSALIVAVVCTLAAIVGAGQASGSNGPVSTSAEMVHRSLAMGAFFALVMCASTALGLAVCPDNLCRAITFGASAVLFIGVVVGVCGFTYTLRPDALEVGVVAWRVASVPRADIDEAHVGHLDGFVGLGVRAIRGGRAFVLSGRKGVWIRTRKERLFLAHEQPDRLLQMIETWRHGAATPP